MTATAALAVSPPTHVTWQALGTSVHVLVLDASGADVARRAVAAVLDEVDATYSRFHDNELTRLNARPGKDVRVGPLLARAIGTALDAALAGTAADGTSAVLVGGYFGGWASLDEVRDHSLDPADRAAGGLGFGCGVVSFAGPDTCGVRATAEIMTFMAGESAAQCGPCVFGLAAIAEAILRLAKGAAADDDLERIDRWAGQVQGRGACHHPDGAIGMLRSARAVFADEFARHQARGRCSVTHDAAA